jgi:hypothetical protein
MKIKYQAPKGRRIKNHDFYWLEHENSLYLYVESIKQWVLFEDIPKNCGYYSTGDTCRSLKAAIRRIKGYNMPKGTKFRLVSKWVGYDIYITK